MITITALGAVVGLIVAIILIMKKTNPAYSLILGSIIGGIVGGANIGETVSLMISGAQGMIPAILRILTAGILAGVLIAMIGGGKSGNIISPNPNTISAADTFNIPLTSLMMAGIIPAIFGIIISIIIAKLLSNKGTKIQQEDIDEKTIEDKPSFFTALIGPLTAIIILSLRPLAGIVIDPLIALPIGGIIGCLAMGKIKSFNNYCIFGLGKMTGVAVLLLGTGTISGIIANSALKTVLTDFLTSTGAPAFLLAPLAGILMSGATASTTSGTAVGSQVFGSTLLGLGVPAINSAAMIHAGATVLDHLPHGSFFHATGGSVNMNMKERLALIPFESLVGITLTIVSTLIYGVFY